MEEIRGLEAVSYIKDNAEAHASPEDSRNESFLMAFLYK